MMSHCYGGTGCRVPYRGCRFGRTEFGFDAFLLFGLLFESLAATTLGYTNEK